MSNDSAIVDEWSRTPLVSCFILRWIGIYLSFVFLLGICLNAFVLYKLLDKKRAQSPVSVYMIALSFADLMAALLGIPLPLSSNLACRWLYGKYLCYYEGFVAYFVGMIGLYLLTALSLSRYWMIVTPVRTRYVTFRTAYLSVIFSVVGGLFWAIGPVFGWNNYTLEGVLTSCSIRWQERTFEVVSYNTSMFIFAYFIPLSIMIYCNMKIYFEVRHVSCHRPTRGTTMNSTLTFRRINLERRMAKTILTIIISFTMSWTPYATVAFISSYISPTLISPLAGTLPAIFAKSSIVFVPLVYILTNSQMRTTFTRRQRKKDSRAAGWLDQLTLLRR